MCEYLLLLLRVYTLYVVVDLETVKIDTLIINDNESLDKSPF